MMRTEMCMLTVPCRDTDAHCAFRSFSFSKEREYEIRGEDGKGSRHGYVGSVDHRMLENGTSIELATA
jgi:hypothetical protein